MGTSPHPNNSFGIYERAYTTWLPKDLDHFFRLFQPNLVGKRPVIEPVDGGYMQTKYQISPFNLEPDLDMEYAMALTAPQTVTNVQVGDQFLGDINDMLAAFDKYYCGSLDPGIDPMFPDPRGYNKTRNVVPSPLRKSCRSLSQTPKPCILQSTCVGSVSNS